MGIDSQSEELKTLAEASRELPRAGNRKIHVSTLWRWCRGGIRGVRLEYVRLGSRIFTSKDALGRFANRLAELDAEDTPQSVAPPPRPRTNAHREREVARAESVLRSGGIL